VHATCQRSNGVQRLLHVSLIMPRTCAGVMFSRVVQRLGVLSCHAVAASCRAGTDRALVEH